MAAELVITPSGESGFVLAGELDTHTAPRLVETLAGVAAGSDIRVDLAETTFMSSAGLSALLNAQRRLADSSGSLVVTDASPAVRRLLELSGVADMLGIS